MMIVSKLTTLTLALYLQAANAAPDTTNSPEIDVSDRYIVTLKPTANLASHLDYVQEIHNAATLASTRKCRTYDGPSMNFSIGNFHGYGGHFSNSVIDQLRAHDEIEHIDQDHVISLAGMMTTQTPSPYNLNIISHHRADDISAGYVYDSSAGAGTVAYVLDSGIEVGHPEFSGRAAWGYNAIPGSQNRDRVGHGTSTASIIGGTVLGVAKKTYLIAVKCFEGEKTTANHIMDGLNWAYNHAAKNGIKHKAVINASFGGSAWSRLLSKALDEVYKNGVLTVAAAGNERSPAVKYWTVRHTILVGGTDRARRRAPYSNYGPPVTMYAPGSDIYTAWNEGRAAKVSGTSAAAPHVAGLALYFKGMMMKGGKHGGMDAAATRKMVVDKALKNVVSNGWCVRNRFAYNGSGK